MDIILGVTQSLEGRLIFDSLVHIRPTAKVIFPMVQIQLQGLAQQVDLVQIFSRITAVLSRRVESGFFV